MLELCTSVGTGQFPGQYLKVGHDSQVEGDKDKAIPVTGRGAP
jgi:hypothetical protein